MNRLIIIRLTLQWDKPYRLKTLTIILIKTWATLLATRKIIIIA